MEGRGNLSAISTALFPNYVIHCRSQRGRTDRVSGRPAGRQCPYNPFLPPLLFYSRPTLFSPTRLQARFADSGRPVARLGLDIASDINNVTENSSK